MQRPYLEKFGGAVGVSRIVFRFYDLLLESERLRRFFEGIDMPRLIEHQTAVIVTVLSGEPPLSRREILAAHAHLDIGPEDFDEMIALLQRAVAEAGVAQADAHGLIQYYTGFRSDLVRAGGAT
jgi:hemoglobin